MGDELPDKDVASMDNDGALSEKYQYLNGITYMLVPEEKRNNSQLFSQQATSGRKKEGEEKDEGSE